MIKPVERGTHDAFCDPNARIENKVDRLWVSFVYMCLWIHFIIAVGLKEPGHVGDGLDVTCIRECDLEMLLLCILSTVDWNLSFHLCSLPSYQTPQKKTVIWRQGTGRLCSRLGCCFTLWRWLFNATFLSTEPGLGKGSWNEPGQCNFPVCVCEPLGAAVWPQRPPGPRRTLQAAAVFPPVSVVPGLRWVQMRFWFYCDCKLLCR